MCISRWPRKRCDVIRLHVNVFWPVQTRMYSARRLRVWSMSLCLASSVCNWTVDNKMKHSLRPGMGSLMSSGYIVHMPLLKILREV